MLVREGLQLGVGMGATTILVELLLAGFFAIACLRAHGPFRSDTRVTFSDLFRLSGRLERFKQSRWQWFSMVLLLLVIRLQQQRPLAMELMVAIQLVVFLALPVRANAKTS